ncbi:acyl-CoA thioester hydrolase/BAAT C-terminal domain-containing protein [Flavobacterium oreochromis]|uniref:acyl-CoA thioester hydrolase/BAAT C-terminal domain-containing protein n=1 Tax=Flavobacterium oreochromis TaxID=2906078 RepID=UPI00385BEE5A
MNILKKILQIIIFLNCQENCFSQTESIENLGFRFFNFTYKNEVVNLLVQSKKGDENIKKPLIIYLQGSLAKPLIINYPKKDNYKYSLAFPFNTEKIIQKYHIAVISKPYIPIVVNINDLDENYTYIDSISKKNPINFLKNDNLEYLTKRNIRAIEFLKRQNFVNSSKIILLGHSEGSRIAYEITKRKNNISNLIYLSGNPFGRYMNISQSIRASQDTSYLLKKDDAFSFWLEIVQNKTINNFEEGKDTYKSWYNYSKPYFDKFLKIRKPVFIGYGTRDDSSAFNDLYYFYTLLYEKKNFYVKPYVGLEHSFYKVNDDTTVNYDISYFDKVVDDFLKWLEQN